MRLPTPVLLALLGAAFVTLVGLGVWQLQRNEWKNDLVALSHARTDEPPLALNDTSDLDGESDAEAIDYRRVTLDGEWRWDDRFFVANRVRASRLGEELVVPVLPAAGGPAVLVNLGWLPDGERDRVLPEIEVGERLSGLARDYSSLDGRQIPSGSWTSMAPDDLEDTLGYPVTDWVLLAGEERARNAPIGTTYPVQGWERFHSTTPHIEYALTWFGIAGVLVAAAVARLVVAPRRARRAEQQPTPASLEG